MLHSKIRQCALLGGALLAASTTFAQSPNTDNRTLLDLLISKGVITAGEAQQLTVDMAKAQAGNDVTTSSADKYLKRLTLTGRFQVQFADLGTGITGFQNNPPAVLPAHPVASEHFLMRRVYLGTKVDFTDNFSGVVNRDFANVSFDAAYIEWKQSEALVVDAVFRKAPFGYEELTSSGDLKAIERSEITRYIDEPNNGRRLGAASYRTGLYVSGAQDGFFYTVAATNPERNEYSGDSTAGSTSAVNAINGSGGVGNYRQQHEQQPGLLRLGGVRRQVRRRHLQGGRRNRLSARPGRPGRDPRRRQQPVDLRRVCGRDRGPLRTPG